MQDAARAQYEPTSVPSIGPPSASPAAPHALPVTGSEVWLVILIGVLAVASGTLIRPFVRRR
jgi:hypothetical protein